MFHRLIFPLLFVLSPLLPLHGQQKDTAPPVQFRAVLHDPMQPVANLFYPDKTGALLPLNFRPQALTESHTTIAIDGKIKLYDKAVIDPENPDANLAASVSLAQGLKQVILIVMPTPNRSKPAYQMTLIDDSEEGFPGGSSKLLSLVAVDVAVEAGEHKQMVAPGKITILPPVKAVNDFNMAQTNFRYQYKEKWTAFTERQLHYLDSTRRIFIIHATPGAIQPTVTTIVDTKTKF